MIIINEQNHTVDELMTAVSRILKNNRLVVRAWEEENKLEYVVEAKPFKKDIKITIDIHLIFRSPSALPPVEATVSVWGNNSSSSYTPAAKLDFKNTYEDFVKKLSSVLGKQFIYRHPGNPIVEIPVWDIGIITKRLNKILVFVRNYNRISSSRGYKKL